MAQVRVCLSCGTIWKDGTIAYIDGFCLHCPGELGPMTDAAKAGDAAWAAKSTPPPAAAKGGQVDLAALNAARENAKPPVQIKTDVPAGVPSSPDDLDGTVAIAPLADSAVDATEPTGTDGTTVKSTWSGEQSTTARIGGADEDDLEPGGAPSPSSALSKVNMPAILPGQSGSRPATTVTGSQVEISLEALEQTPGTSRPSRRHPESGTGDTTAEIVLGDLPMESRTAIPTRPPVRPTAAPSPFSGKPARAAGPASAGSAPGGGGTGGAAVTARAPSVRTPGVPARLATLTWTCRSCSAVYPPGSACISTKRCSACSEKIQPELAPVPPGTASLLLYDPDTRVRIGRFPLTGDVFLIGRLDPGANLFPELNLIDWLSPDDARQLSRRHCEIMRDRNAVPEVWYMVPAQGNSGVYYKGNLIEPPERVRLEGQEVFGLGGDRIFLRFDAAGDGSVG